MKTILKLATSVAAVALLAGCPGTNLPGAAGLPGGGTTSPMGPDTALAAQCTSDKPAAATSVGSAKHGRYNNQTMPNAWDNLDSETKVTESIDAAKARGGNEWNCFNKFYGGLLTVYNSIKAAR